MANRLSDEEVLAQIEAARARPQAMTNAEVRAKRARYDRKTRRIMVDLTNGAVFGFPAEMGQGLRGASSEQLAAVEVSPSGMGLHWEELDADLSVPALLQGMFGTKTWMRELARVGGSARSEAKTNAARKNGLKGGRPRTTTGDSLTNADRENAGAKTL